MPTQELLWKTYRNLLLHTSDIDEEAQKRAELEEQYRLNPYKDMFIARDLRRWREEKALATGKVKKPYGL